MTLDKSIALSLCLNLSCVALCSCQRSDDAGRIRDSIARKVVTITGHNYDISGIEIDKSVNNPAVSHGQIKDPHHTLAGCFFFLAEDTEDPVSRRPKGFIGVYRIRTDSIIWRSDFLSSDFSGGVSGSVDVIDDLNRDGIDEIVVGQAKGNGGQLWVFSWDGRSGKLITQLDDYGESAIMYWGDNYDLKDIDGDGILEIQGEWYKGDGSDDRITVIYAWNGTRYGLWANTSKSLLKGMNK